MTRGFIVFVSLLFSRVLFRIFDGIFLLVGYLAFNISMHADYDGFSVTSTPSRSLTSLPCYPHFFRCTRVKSDCCQAPNCRQCCRNCVVTWNQDESDDTVLRILLQRRFCADALTNCCFAWHRMFRGDEHTISSSVGSASSRKKSALKDPHVPGVPHVAQQLVVSGWQYLVTESYRIDGSLLMLLGGTKNCFSSWLYFLFGFGTILSGWSSGCPFWKGTSCRARAVFEPTDASIPLETSFPLIFKFLTQVLWNCSNERSHLLWVATHGGESWRSTHWKWDPWRKPTVRNQHHKGAFCCWCRLLRSGPCFLQHDTAAGFDRRNRWWSKPSIGLKFFCRTVAKQTCVAVRTASRRRYPKPMSNIQPHRVSRVFRCFERQGRRGLMLERHATLACLSSAWREKKSAWCPSVNMTRKYLRTRRVG